MDVTQYLEIFLDETKEHLQSLSDQFMILEQEPDNMDTINEIFRSAHTLKGMAGTMGYKRMQTLTHDMENVFSEVRNNTIKVDGAMVDLLFQCLDALEEYTENIQNTGDEGTNDNEHLIKALNDYLAKNSGDGAPQPAKEEKKEPAKEEPKQEAGADPGKEKWREIKLGDTEHTVIAEAKKQGKKCLGVTVYVQESCILKAARAFLVYKALEELGDMIVSVPSAQDIEDEHFEFDFSVIILTDADVETVKNAILNVSEIEAAYVGEVEPVQPEEAVKPAAIAEAQPKEEPFTEEQKEVIRKDIKAFLDSMFGAMSMEVKADITFDDEENSVNVDLSGDNMGVLIGKRGQTLDSIQYLTSLVINKNSEKYVRVKLDTENYRKRRKETLESLAKNIAYKVKRSRRPVSLEPMNPYERRIIHSALQADKFVSTRSEGEEPFRHVVVYLERENNNRYNR